MRKIEQFMSKNKVTVNRKIMKSSYQINERPIRSNKMSQYIMNAGNLFRSGGGGPNGAVDVVSVASEMAAGSGLAGRISTIRNNDNAYCRDNYVSLNSGSFTSKAAGAVSGTAAIIPGTKFRTKSAR